MSEAERACGPMLREITQSADRSCLFWWMVEHHDELKTTASGRRLQWAALCTRFAETIPDRHQRQAGVAEDRSRDVVARKARGRGSE